MKRQGNNLEGYWPKPESKVRKYNNQEEASMISGSCVAFGHDRIVQGSRVPDTSYANDTSSVAFGHDRTVQGSGVPDTSCAQGNIFHESSGQCDLISHPSEFMDTQDNQQTCK